MYTCILCGKNVEGNKEKYTVHGGKGALSACYKCIQHVISVFDVFGVKYHVVHDDIWHFNTMWVYYTKTPISFSDSER